MLYFAYGSNMCTGRLQGRVPSANPVRNARLGGHTFHFHKRSTDGSGKGNAFATGNNADVVWGVVFEIAPSEKPALDRAEGLGHGYNEAVATVASQDANPLEVVMYVAD